ncbi:uncharacterized protein BJ171DRAFT_116618 [Polychytrium aggregatum]|uniref:uncharacterized protein n=1 Tax=Polychytrium aggregatum TaxID=110093 RepID=UPI0022FDD3FE|nr:uncharacterized protein BJ171DRAFT_116618 [Polychytrium aggregatum]KAI9209382.1 hypothetical protein BJ171DRAFT_116618 [Polychytrium aggregatum]
MPFLDELTPSNAVLFMQSLDGVAGVVSITSLCTIIFLNSWRISFNYRSLLRLMVYTDCVAWVFDFLSLTYLPDTCPGWTFQVLSNVVWCIKDTFKFTYIVWRTIYTFSATRQDIDPIWVHIGSMGAGIVSFVLYAVFMAFYYSGFRQCTAVDEESAQIPLLVLYVYWLMVDVVCTLSIIWTVYRIAYPKTMGQHKSQMQHLRNSLMKSITRELKRLVITAGLGSFICGAKLYEIFHSGPPILNIKNTLFTLSQHVLVLSVLRWVPFDEAEVSSRENFELVERS